MIRERVSNVAPINLIVDKQELKKYSVLANDGTSQFVHIFRQNCWWVNCQSGICSKKKGKSQKVRALADAETLCPHLSRLREFGIGDMGSYDFAEDDDSPIRDADIEDIVSGDEDDGQAEMIEVPVNNKADGLEDDKVNISEYV